MPGPSQPILLAPNTIAHFYPGGGALSRFRGVDPGANPSPEDWVGSTTARLGQAPLGLTRLENGELFRDAIEADPVGYLGPEHVETFGSDMALLVKLLDSSIRLIVHAHPDREFARHHLGTVHGKTEAWVVLSENVGEVWVGFSKEVAQDELAEWVERNAFDEMLGSLNLLQVARGDSVLVPAGVPHAVGPGVFVVELQEPTDFSIALEQRGLGQPELGLGWPLVLQAIDRSAWSSERLSGLRGPGLAKAGRVLPSAADPFFRADVSRPLSAEGSPLDASEGRGSEGRGSEGRGSEARAAEGRGSEGPVSEGAASVAKPGDDLGTGLAVLVVLDGEGELVTESSRIGVRRGQTLLLPFGAGPAEVQGDAVVLACRPPRPGALEPARPAV